MTRASDFGEVWVEYQQLGRAHVNHLSITVCNFSSSVRRRSPHWIIYYTDIVIPLGQVPQEQSLLQLSEVYQPTLPVASQDHQFVLSRELVVVPK